jgi:hypothetical protein
VISFIKKDPILEKDYLQIKEELSEFGIKIYPYVSEKGLKCSVWVSDFYRADLEED